MNRINNKLKKDKKLLSIYFTAGYPKLNDTVSVIESLEKNGVDFIEIGLPFSDPLADGPTIQASSTAALENGMTSEVLFNQLKDIRKTVSIPLIIMGYFNPMMQYGIEAFCEKCAEIGIDGLIIPDLPVQDYNENYKAIFEKYGLINVFLITPQTSEERIRFIDSISNGFIYMVSSTGVTGAKASFGNTQLFKNFGFNMNVRWQNAFVWESTFLDATVDGRTVLDAQISYSVPSFKSTFKIGAANLGGKEYFTRNDRQRRQAKSPQ